MTLTAIEIPMSFYNISAALGNNYLNLTRNGTTTTITIADGNYSVSTLKTTLNAALWGYDLSYNYSGSNSTLNTGTGVVTVNFAVDSVGGNDKYNIKSKLGWILGFRNTTYTIRTTSTTSEAFYDFNGPRYLYLAIDEYNKGNQHSFVSPLYNSLINKNIIARITMDNATHGFGTILPANLTNGLLVSDLRNYTGKIDLLKMNVQLLDENGHNMALNGLDFSFSLAVEHE
jgi:hypothetical protein